MSGPEAGGFLQRLQGLSPVGETGFDGQKWGSLTLRWHSVLGRNPRFFQSNPLPNVSPPVPVIPPESASVVESIVERLRSADRRGEERDGG